jgi:hypothetical protein
MKSTLKTIILLLVPVAVVLSSCSVSTFNKNKFVHKYANVYMSQASNNPDSRSVLIVDSSQTIAYQADYAGASPTSSNILVHFNVSPSLADSFNTAHKTSYPIMPKGSYKLTQQKAIIPAGKWSTKKLKLKIMAKGNIKADCTKYLLPVSIKVNGKVRVNANLRTTYFLIQGFSPK